MKHRITVLINRIVERWEDFCEDKQHYAPRIALAIGILLLLLILFVICCLLYYFLGVPPELADSKPTKKV